MYWLAVFVTGLANFMFSFALTRIIKVAVEATLRAKKKPTARNIERRNVVLKHQLTLIVLAITILIAARSVVGDVEVVLMVRLTSMVFLAKIWSIANIDTRIKRHYKQQKSAAKATLQTPATEEGAQ